MDVKFSKSLITSALIITLCGCGSTPEATKNSQSTQQSNSQQQVTPSSHADLLTRAAIGDVVAQYYIGEDYLNGTNGVEQNKVEAAAWMYLAYENSQREDILSIFSQNFANEDKEIIAQAEQRLIELKKSYAADVIEQQFSPISLSDQECEELMRHKPIKRIPPKYPRNLAKQSQEGVVEVSYTVSQQGYIRDIETILYSHEPLLTTTLDAMYQWEYSKAPLHKGYTLRMSYQLAGKKKYTPAIKQLQKKYTAAKEQDASAQFTLGRQLYVLREFLDDKSKNEFASWVNQQSSVQHSPFEYREINKWLLKAAQNGHPQAQYELGINIQNGQGCEADHQKGLAWLQTSALQNFLPAKILVANKKLATKDVTEHKVALDILRQSLISHNVVPKLDLAWHLVASEFNQLQNPQEALTILDDLPFHQVDKVRFIETKAAAYAALGDFDQAIEVQLEAKEQAEELGWQDIPDIEFRLQQYRDKQVSKGSYYL